MGMDYLRLLFSFSGIFLLAQWSYSKEEHGDLSTIDGLFAVSKLEEGGLSPFTSVHESNKPADERINMTFKRSKRSTNSGSYEEEEEEEEEAELEEESELLDVQRKRGGLGPHVRREGLLGAHHKRGGFGANRKRGGYGANRKRGGYGAHYKRGGYGAHHKREGFGANRKRGGYGANRKRGGLSAPVKRGGLSVNTKRGGHTMFHNLEDSAFIPQGYMPDEGLSQSIGSSSINGRGMYRSLDSPTYQAESRYKRNPRLLDEYDTEKLAAESSFAGYEDQNKIAPQNSF